MRLLLASSLLLGTSALAAIAITPADTSGCATVRPVTTSTDIAGLQADADCFGRAYAEDKAAAQAYNDAAAKARASQKYRLDRIAWLKAHPTPSPTPTPTPTPSPAPTGPEGASPIASNFDVNTALAPAHNTGAIPGTAAPDTNGAFRFVCGPGQLLYDDPIVYPGQPGKSHLHQFYGNTGANADSTFASLRASGESTCNNMPGTGHAANRSGYWEPAMLDGRGYVVLSEYTTVYYKREEDGGPYCAPSSTKRMGICIGIPNALKFISGFDMASGKPGQNPVHFKCATAAGAVLVQAQPSLEALAAKGCAPGNMVAMGVQSGKCWSGQLDSADHRSHLAMPVNGKCDPAHPYLIPQFTIVSFYRVRQGDDLKLWSLSSDAMYPNLPKGSTGHFDYFEAWDAGVKDMWVKNCIGKLLNCSGGDLGNGKQLKGASKPNTVPNYRVPIPA